MSPPPILVLDLDGTLIDTAPDLVLTLNAVLAQEGRAPLSLAQVRSMVGAGAKALLVRGLAAAGDQVAPERLEALYQDFLAHYRAHIADASVPFPGALASLDRFDQAGWRLAVCTNKLEGLARSLLGTLGLADRFAAICGGDTFAQHKPDPRHLTGTIGRAGGAVERAVMVGDSSADIVAAQAAGVPVVGMTFGYTDTPVAELGPDAVLDHFDDLFDTAHRLLEHRERKPARP
ncbi:phosphoglycolate phosphatase [Chelatococcus reniformis]|uniref:Phosphoglycolate phosphatase n=1 Tax=Chelatococcus reniformis TaxID=1494448 RepID=A0A916UGS6_9HYPH|nr:phosphoglycolate phosphatase [Chelatococcus reniformis]GGC73166.1 phosphoglycolate phosphatase, bacterial [Chelatococcus reniformis]